jgi:integrase
VPHHPAPFYRSARKAWFLQLGKRQIRLAADEKEAWKRYHELMAANENESPPRPVDASLAVVVIDEFLGWVERRKARRTYEWYQRHCEEFAKSIPAGLKVSEIKPLHLTRLVDAHGDWSPTTKHGLCRAVQRAFNWAQRQGMIDRSPLGIVEKPEPQDRDVVITPEEYEVILGMVKDGFRELLRRAWESGIRPQEIRVVEAKHLDLEHGRIVFPVREAKGKKLPRVVYLPDEALGLCRRLADAYPTGPIFRNSDGRPWTRYAINCAFIRLQIAFGRQEMKREGVTVPKLPRFKKGKVPKAKLEQARAEQKEKLRERRKEITRLALERGKKLHLGAFRKSFATEALKNGVDPVTASHLLGHSNTNMLAKVYARLAQDPAYLREQAKRATGK